MPWIINNGGQAYLECGNPTTAARSSSAWWATWSGPAIYEIPLGTPFAKLLETGRRRDGGRALKAVIPGGSSAPVLPAKTMMDLTMDYDAIAKAGSMLGSGARHRHGRDALHGPQPAAPELFLPARKLRPVHALPRRHGLAVAAGGSHRAWQGPPEDLDLLDSVAENIKGRTICALGDAAAMPVQGMLEHFRDEFEYHVEHKTCLCRHR